MSEKAKDLEKQVGALHKQAAALSGDKEKVEKKLLGELEASRKELNQLATDYHQLRGRAAQPGSAPALQPESQPRTTKPESVGSNPTASTIQVLAEAARLNVESMDLFKEPSGRRNNVRSDLQLSHYA